ncbi:MAG: hypothetical protein ACJ72N_08145 [Labedaea sp.]
MSTSTNGLEARRWQHHRAARVVARCAQDAVDLVELLNMLGLTAVEGRSPPAPEVHPGQGSEPRPVSEAERDLASNLLSAVAHELW